MKAFDIVGDHVSFTPEFLAVPEFKAIWDRDRTKNKGRATKELSFIAFLCDNTPANPYMGYSEEIREDILKEDFIGNAKWDIDLLVGYGIRKLNTLFQTPSSRLLAGALVAADQLAGWFKSIDFSKIDDSGKQVFSARELSSNLGSVGTIIKSLKSLEKQVRQEQLDDNMARGGAEIGIFEIPTDGDDGELPELI